MIEAWRRQFTLKQLSLEHEQPIIFVISQWQKDHQKPSPIYLIYRWIVALTFFITLVLSVVDLKHPGSTASFKAKWLIYLTNWGYAMCMLQSLLSAIILSVCVLAPYLRSLPDLRNTALRIYKFYWVINIIGTDMAFGITSLYWSLIYDEKTMDLDAMNYFVHGNNSVLMFIDLFVVSHPIRLLHCCYPIVLGICYALFSVIYYAAGGVSREGREYIYTILDWRKPEITTAVCIAVLGFIVIVHIICWGLHKFRMWLRLKYFHKGQREDIKDLSEEKTEPSKSAYINEGLANDAV